jgi:hypothetical protein
LSELEEEHWEGMIKWAFENQVVLPPHFIDNERKILRYLQASKFDYQKTFDAICNFMEWEQKLPELDAISQRVMNVIQSGCIYVYGRDKYYRPTIVYNVNAMKTRLADVEAQEAMSNCLDVISRYTIDHIMLPARVE